MKSSRGFTLIELMAVVTITVIVLAMSWGPVLGWYTQFRFEAAGRSFINAGHAARMQAISGLPVLRMRSATSIQRISSTRFRVFLDTVTFVCDNCGAIPGGTPTKSELPIKAEDYVALTGVNSPDYFNGNLFRVIEVSPTDPTVTANGTDQWGHKQWQVAGLSFDCESCDDSGSNCLQWSGLSASYSLTTGKVQPTAGLKFIQNTVLPANQRTPFSVAKNKTGSTLECYYDPKDYEISINGVIVNPSRSVVFDFGGATRNHVNYLVEVKKMKKGVVDARASVLSFRIDHTGRISLGR